MIEWQKEFCSSGVKKHPCLSLVVNYSACLSSAALWGKKIRGSTVVHYCLAVNHCSSKTKPCQFGSIQIRRSIRAMTYFMGPFVTARV